MRNFIVVCFVWFCLASAAVSGAAGEITRPETFTVAGMRVLPKQWDKAHNFTLLQRYANQAAERGAKLVVTCEGFLDGYTSNPKLAPGSTREKMLAIGEPLDGPWLARTAELAKELGIYISIGFAERSGEQMHNSLVVFAPSGERVLHYRKAHTDGEPFTTPGNSFPVAETDLGVWGSLICYDRRFPEVPRILALKGAQVLLLPAFGTDGERNEALLRTRAWENSVWIVYVKQNQVLVINPGGKIVARDSGQGDELVCADIELNDEVGSGDILNRRSPEVYRELLEREAKLQQ